MIAIDKAKKLTTKYKRFNKLNELLGEIYLDDISLLLPFETLYKEEYEPLDKQLDKMIDVCLDSIEENSDIMVIQN